MKKQNLKKALSSTLLFVFGGLLVSEDVFSNEKLDKSGADNWLTFAETPSYFRRGRGCHAVVISPRWALSTNQCVPETYQYKTKLRLSRKASQSFTEVDISYTVVPAFWVALFKPSVYPVLLRLRSEFSPPFAQLSYKHNRSWYVDLAHDMHLPWVIHYLNRTMVHSLEEAVYPPMIDRESKSTTPINPHFCFRYPETGDWTICTSPESGGEKIQSSEYFIGSVLMNSQSEIEGLRGSIDKFGMDRNKNYFIPLLPYRSFIESTIANEPEAKWVKHRGL